MASSHKFCDTLHKAHQKIVTDQDLKKVSFAQSKVAKKHHHTPVKYNTLPTLNEELNLFHEIFEDSSVKSFGTLVP